MPNSEHPGESLLVEKVYLMITTRCNVNCRFCIVRKTDVDMDVAVMRRAIDFVLASAGLEKKIVIYGGEPTVLRSGVLEVLNYTKEKRAGSAKRIELYLYTNGLLLDAELRAILAAHQVKVVFSLDIGQRLLGPQSREDDQHRTFATREQNARHLLNEVGPLQVCAAAVVLPDEVGRLREMFHYLTDDMGFQVIKFLPGLIRYRWTPEQVEAFREQLNGVFADMMKMVLSGREVYLDGINEALYRVELHYPDDLLALSVLEFYPDGRFGLSPCEFEAPDGIENVNEIDQFILGTSDSIRPSEIKRKVQALDWPKHAGLLAFSVWAGQAAQSLTKKSESNPRLAAYIRRARRLSFA